MFHIRTTKTASGGTAVQIVRYQNRKLIIIKHLGSAHDDEALKTLKETATTWIDKATKQQSLFSNKSVSPTIQLKQCQYVGFRYALIYESLYQLCKLFKFHRLRNKLLIDLVIARIIEPGSKLQSIEFLKEFIGIEHKRQELYRQLSCDRNT